MSRLSREEAQVAGIVGTRSVTNLTVTWRCYTHCHQYTLHIITTLLWLLRDIVSRHKDNGYAASAILVVGRVDTRHCFAVFNGCSLIVARLTSRQYAHTPQYNGIEENMAASRPAITLDIIVGICHA